MKRSLIMMTFLSAIAFAFISLSFAAEVTTMGDKAKEMGDMKGMSGMKEMGEMPEKGEAKGMKEMKDKKMDMSQAGKVIRTQKKDGLTLTYRLVDMKERMAKMAGMEMMKETMASHHLMVGVAKEGGGMVADAKVGFVVTGPDGKERKGMAMGMDGGHGADVDMKAKGKYTVKAKVKVGEKVTMDEFTYTVE